MEEVEAYVAKRGGLVEVLSESCRNGVVVGDGGGGD